MALPTAQVAAARWAERATGAQNDWLRGIEEVSQAPGAKAAAARDKWVAKMTSQAVQQKWTERVGAVTLQQWKEVTAAKGPGRYGSGISASRGKYQQSIAQVLQHIASGQSAIQSMPNITLEQNIQRMAAFVTHMSKFKLRQGS